MLEGDFLPPSGRICASTFFELPLEKRPTAIFAASDEMAYGAISAAEEYGLSIPRDVALVGFDDDAHSMHTRPALTTVKQPFFEMGQRGIELLLSQLDLPASPMRNQTNFSSGQRKTNEARSLTEAQPARILLPTSLIVRESCGATSHSSTATSSSKVAL